MGRAVCVPKAKLPVGFALYLIKILHYGLQLQCIHPRITCLHQDCSAPVDKHSVRAASVLRILQHLSTRRYCLIFGGLTGVMGQDVVPCFEQLNNTTLNYCVHPRPYCSTFRTFRVVTHCQSLPSFDSAGSCQHLVFVLLLGHRHLRQPGPLLRHESTLSGLLQPTWRILAPSAYQVPHCSPKEDSSGCLHRLVNSRCYLGATCLRIALVAAVKVRSFLLAFVYSG